VEEHVEAFHKRRLNKRYVVVFCDATYLNVRRDSVSKEALHVLAGITQEGIKEVIDYRIFPQESSENYRDMLLDIQSRGAQEILLFVSDGLTGFKDACTEVYPQAMHQACWVHVQRNIARLVRAKDRKEILDLLKPVYQASNQLEAEEALSHFNLQVSPRYPKVVKLLNQNQSLFSFMLFPKSIQRSLYTTNLLEGMNKQLKRQTKRKEQFPNEAALDRFICNQMMEYNQRFSRRIHKGFDLVQTEIADMFENQYES
jgi:putative transposase